jgi:hypothetical protein
MDGSATAGCALGTVETEETGLPADFKLVLGRRGPTLFQSACRKRAWRLQDDF